MIWVVIMNNTIEYLKLLQNFSHPEDSRNRKLLKSYELTKGLYNYGTIINSVDNNYEVYCYVISNDNSIIASSLLLKEFNDINRVQDIFEKLEDKESLKNINNVSEDCFFI